MNRRDFLRGLLGAAVVVPAVKYILPPVGGWRKSVAGVYYESYDWQWYESKSKQKFTANEMHLGSGVLFFPDGQQLPIHGVKFSIDKAKALHSYGNVSRVAYAANSIDGTLRIGFVNEDFAKELVRLQNG